MTVLLLTATITPPIGAPGLTRIDPVIRMGDYHSTMRYYLKMREIDTIVFVDNSGSDLSFLRAITDGAIDKKVELISFEGLNYPPGWGRAFGELNLINEALERSQYLRELNPNEMFWKSTGRNRVENLDRIVKTAPVNCDYYCDLRKFPNKWHELRLFACTRHGFKKYLFDRLQGVRHDWLTEHGWGAPETWLFNQNFPHISDARFCGRFRIQPIYSGVSGYNESDYGRPRKRIEYFIKGIARKLLPWLWI